MTKTLTIEGMMCNHCVMHVTKALECLSGVEKAICGPEEKTAVVTLNGEVSDAELTDAVKEAGYEVTKLD